MAHELKEIEWDGKPRDLVYLHFSDAPIVRMEEHAEGEVVVDFDRSGDVVGIEMLSLDADIWEAVFRIGKQHDLGFTLLLAAAKRPRVKAR